MQKLINRILIILIFINFAYAVSGVIHYPLISIDVYSIWLLKAKAFWVNNGFPLQFLQHINYSHPQYPVLLPYLLFLLSKAAGTYKEIYLLMIYPFLYLAILFVAYKTFKNLKIPSTLSLLFLYIYSMLSPLLAQAGRQHAGNADICLTLLYWAILYLVIDFFKKSRSIDLWIIMILIILASQIKLEGVYMTSIILFLPTPWRKKIMLAVFAVIPSLVWIYIRKSLQIPADFGIIIPSVLVIVNRLYTIIRQVVIEMVNVRNWYVFWIIFWLLVYAQETKDKILKTTIQPTLIIMSLMFVFTYLIADLDIKYYVTSSSDRIMLQLSPFFYTIFVDRARNLFKQVKII